MFELMKMTQVSKSDQVRFSIYLYLGMLFFEVRNDLISLATRCVTCR